MLAKRIHILVEEELYKKVVLLARKEGVSVGRFVREAITERLEKMKRAEAVKRILKFTPVRIKKGEILDWIKEGRRF